MLGGRKGLAGAVQSEGGELREGASGVPDGAQAGGGKGGGKGGEQGRNTARGPPALALMTENAACAIVLFLCFAKDRERGR